MGKYVATRKDICAGQLIKSIGMECTITDGYNKEINEQALAKLGITNFKVSGSLICRGMLFNVNDNGLANDLIYTTPTSYPIEGVQPKVNVQSEFIIENYVELEELLKYLKYGVDLTQNDLNKIYRKLITHSWWLDHHIELFGYKKMKRNWYGSGGNETLPMSIYNNLDSISCIRNGKPHSEEPGYTMIKRRK